MKRSLCILLISAVIISIFPITVSSTNATQQPTKNSIPVVVNKDGSSSEIILSVLVLNDELYIHPHDLAKITRYSFVSDASRLIFKLGHKSVVVDLSTNTMLVNFTSQEFSGYLKVENDYFLPMSEILPWLNVECYESKGTLYIDSDIISYWEAIADFNSNDYLFDLAENYGQTTGDVVGLCAISVFDSILDLDNLWKKVVCIDGTRLYDYEIYKSCLREFALPESGTEADIQKGISEVYELVSASSQFMNSTYKMLYNKETYQKLSYLFGEDVAAGSAELPTDAKQLTESLKLAKNTLKYLKTGYIYTRIALIDTTAYANALRCIYPENDQSIPVLVKLAVKEAVQALDSQQGAIINGSLTILGEYGSSTLAKVGEEAIEKAISKTALAGVGTYLDIIDATLSLVWPINDAYKDLAKMTVYQSIQYDALNAFYKNAGTTQPLSALDISNGRTSALIFLKTAKKCYKAQQKTFDLFGAEGLLDYKIQEIDSKILEFELAMLAEEHDAISSKDLESAKLKEIWRESQYLTNTTTADITHLIGTWNLYKGGHQDVFGNWEDVQIYTIDLAADGAIKVCAGILYSEHDEYYTGNWHVVSSTNEHYQVQIDAVGGEYTFGEPLPQNEQSLLVEMAVIDNMMTVKKVGGNDICVAYDQAYEKNLSDDTWKERQLQQLTSSTPDNSYLGNWVYGGISGSIDERTLTISSIDSTCINFDLSYYKIANFSEQTAIIHTDGTAKFIVSNEEYTISGIMAFGDDVTIYITQSNHPHIKADLQKYERKQEDISSSTLQEWDTISDDSLKWKYVSLLEKILTNQEGVYQARVLLSEDATLSDYRTLEIYMIQVNGEWLSDHSELYYSVAGFQDRVAFFLCEPSGCTDIAWEYDWNGKYLGSSASDEKTLSEDILSLINSN